MKIERSGRITRVSCGDTMNKSAIDLKYTEIKRYRLHNLGDIRRSAGMTLRALAEKTGLSFSFISDVEHERRTLGEEAFLSIINSL